jgi:predicted nucleic acid-binding protein
MLLRFKNKLEMNGIDFIADTNFLIHVNQGDFLVEPFLEYSFAVSYITEIELLGAFNLNKTQMEQFDNLLNDCFIFEMNEKIKQKCISLRRQHKIKIPDAIIAATSLIYGIPLITSDQDFQKITELNLIYLKNN